MQPFSPALTGPNQLTKFIDHIQRKNPALKFNSYNELHQWSIRHSDEFWHEIVEYYTMIYDSSTKLEFKAQGTIKESIKSLEPSRLNYAENMLLSHKHARSTDKIALVTAFEADPNQGERGATHLKGITFNELYDQVRIAAYGLKQFGVKPGDTVAAFMPNNAEAVVAFLAANSIGAVWSSCPVDFGEHAVLERLEQVNPVVLFSADVYRYRAKTHSIYPKLQKIIDALVPQKLKHVVVVGQLDEARHAQVLPEPTNKEKITIQRWTDWYQECKQNDTSTEISFYRQSGLAPIYVLFSSGTTGKPKGIIHHAAGMLLHHKMSQSLHHDLGPDDCLLQFTTLGWMMWNFAIAALSLGTTIVCFDGSPLDPPSILWDLVDKLDVSFLGISPRYLQSLQSSKYKPAESNSLNHLKQISVIGSTCKPELYDFMRDDIKKDMFINNASGGTDICGLFVGAALNSPVYRGEIQAPILGMQIESWDENGKPAPAGEAGNMVCVNPFPNPPLEFLNDPNGERYNSAYFEGYQQPVWCQGDFICVSPETNGILMLGRSDGVLNPSGIRFGSAELYNILESLDARIDDSLAVGQKMDDGDERVLLFLKLKDTSTQELPQDLIDLIKKKIIDNLSRRHVPAMFLLCPDVPYTTNGKKVEVAVKKVISGQPIEKINTSAITAPQVLEWFADRSRPYFA